jgi:hypothetical protein
MVDSFKFSRYNGKCKQRKETKQMNLQQLIKDTAQFKQLDLAKSYANNCHKIQMIILGDNGKYWVARPKTTERLNKLGYQYAD